MSEKPHYPLRDNAADELAAKSGRPLAEITEAAAAAETLAIEDLQISAPTLRAQAEIAREAGYPQLGGNLQRAAELTAVPNATILEMYELLRPARASYEQLLALAGELEQRYNAPATAALVREAAAAYRLRGITERPN